MLWSFSVRSTNPTNSDLNDSDLSDYDDDIKEEIDDECEAYEIHSNNLIDVVESTQW